MSETSETTEATSLSTVATAAIKEAAPVWSSTDTDLMLTSLDEIERVAVCCAESGYYKDVRDASQAVVKMLAGREMGIGPIRALSEIHIIEGKPCASATAIAANVKKSGRYDFRVRERSNERCELEFFERGPGPEGYVAVGTVGWTLEDAQRAGLSGKANWKKYPRAMLFARALTEGVRTFCPDAAGGVVYTPEELMPSHRAREDGTPIDVTPPKPARQAKKPDETKAAETGLSHESIQTIAKAVRDRLMMVGKDPELWPGVAKSLLAALGYTSSTEMPNSELDHLLKAVAEWTPPKES